MQCAVAGVVIALRRRVPEIGIDCGFFDRDREDVLPILCVKCRNSSTRCLGSTVFDRTGASDYESSFLTAFIKSLGFKKILMRSDNEREMLILIEGVMNILTDVELVQVTSPEGDLNANGLAEVGVRENQDSDESLEESVGGTIGKSN